MMKQRIFIVITVLLMVVIGVLLVRYAGESKPKSLQDALPVTAYTLSNGLKVVVVENHRIPAVSHTLFVKVGAADDPAGKSGLAHYLEHLVFKGTKEVSAEEYDRRIQAMGGETNAYTTPDYTAYYVNAPAESLEQVMALESDRFLNLVIEDAAAITERDVIKEERRMRVENNPSNQLIEQMDAVQFLMHPYRMPGIGWAQDIAGLTPNDARQFIAKHYVPSSMVLVVAGDVEPKDVRRLAMRYYGAMKDKKSPERVWYSEPPSIVARQVVLADARVKQRQWLRSYHAPSLGTPYVSTPRPNDTVALELVAQWLGGGKVSVLYQQLVEQEKLAIDVSASYSDTMIGPGSFTIRAIPRDGVSVATLEEALDKALVASLANGPDADSVARAKTLYRAEITYAQDGLSTIASYIGSLMMVGKDQQFFYDLPGAIDAVSAEDMLHIARAVLVKTQSTTGVLLPQEPVASEVPAPVVMDDTAPVGLP